MSAWKMVPTVATDAMLRAMWREDREVCSDVYEAGVAAAPPFVVTDEDVSNVVTNMLAGDPYIFRDFDYPNGIVRAALEAFVKRLGGGE